MASALLMCSKLDFIDGGIDGGCTGSGSNQFFSCPSASSIIIRCTVLSCSEIPIMLPFSDANSLKLAKKENSFRLSGGKYHAQLFRRLVLFRSLTANWMYSNGRANFALNVASSLICHTVSAYDYSFGKTQNIHVPFTFYVLVISAWIFIVGTGKEALYMMRRSVRLWLWHLSTVVFQLWQEAKQ